MIEGCKHGPTFAIPQPCADCERERREEAERLKPIMERLSELKTQAVAPASALPSMDEEVMKEAISDLAWDILHDMAEGDGEHAEELDHGIIAAKIGCFLKAVAPAAALSPTQLELNAWRELGEEMGRVISLMPSETFADWFPDWFGPRLFDLQVGAKASAALSPSEEPKLSDLAAWLDRFRGALERNQENADLYMQEICGMKVWASILREASAPLSPAAQEPAFGSASWPYAPNELCPKCGVVLPCHAHQIPHPRAGELLPSLSPAAQEKNHENSRSIEGRATPESTATSREGARVNEAAAHGHRDSEPNGGRAVRPGVEHAGTTNRLQPDAGQSSVVGLSPAPAPLKELGTDLAWWVRRVVETFRADEAAGYRSKSRTYAIEMLEKGLEVSALSPQPPTEERK